MYWLRKYKGGTKPTVAIPVEVIENVGQMAVKIRMLGFNELGCVNRIRVVNANRLVKTLKRGVA